LSDQSATAAQDDSHDRPDRLSLRHSKLEAKRRLAAGEFTTLHDAQLAVAREHGMSSWAALKEHIAATAAEPSYALAQVRWLFGRYAEAGAPGWTTPSRDELSEHFTEQLLGLVWACSRGWADLEQNVPLGPGHRFPAHGITTLVTSTAVLCLVAGGAVALDDPVNQHLRSLRLADDTVTVRELLSHTGGVDSPPSVWADSTADVAEVLGLVAGCSGPRGKFAFSYGGYAVLGQLIADLTGTSFAQAATRLVLEPLGMTDSWFPAQAPVTPDTARGYQLTDEGMFQPEPLPTFTLQSAGGLWSTGPDLVRFGSGWRTLLPGELAEQALRPHARQYDSAAEIGLGWLLQRPLDAAGHSGSGPGSSASLITRPSTGRTGVVLTNRLSPVEAVNAKLHRSAAYCNVPL
jgi:CubicO group peptidase (beta-lactamase class C family)